MHTCIITRCNNEGCSVDNWCGARILIDNHTTFKLQIYTFVCDIARMNEWQSPTKWVTCMYRSIKKVVSRLAVSKSCIQNKCIMIVRLRQGISPDGNRHPKPVIVAMVRDYSIQCPLWLWGQSVVNINGNSCGQVWGDHLPSWLFSFSHVIAKPASATQLESVQRVNMKIVWLWICTLY